MSNEYSNPDLTVRDIVGVSKTYFDALFDHLTTGSAKPERPTLLDGPSHTVANQVDDMLTAQLNLTRAEQQRLAVVVSSWEPPL